MNDVNVVGIPGGSLCFSVTYVSGGNSDCFIKLNCDNNFIQNVTINGRNACIDVPAHPGYEILATDFDGDAENKIDTIAPFTTTVGVPSATTVQRISQTGNRNNYNTISMGITFMLCCCFSSGYTLSLSTKYQYDSN